MDEPIARLAYTYPFVTFDPSLPDVAVSNQLARAMSTILMRLYSNLASSVTPLQVTLKNPHQVIQIWAFSKWTSPGVEVLWFDRVTQSRLQQDFKTEKGMSEWVSFCQDMIERRRSVQAHLAGWRLEFERDTAAVVKLQTEDAGVIARIVEGAR